MAALDDALQLDIDYAFHDSMLDCVPETGDDFTIEVRAHGNQWVVRISEKGKLGVHVMDKKAPIVCASLDEAKGVIDRIWAGASQSDEWEGGGVWVA